MSMLSILQAVVSILLLLLVCCYCWYQWSQRRILKMARNLPTVLPALPLLGHLHYLPSIQVSLESKTMTLARGFSDHQTSCLWLGPLPIIIVNKPEDVKTILNSSKTMEKAAFYESFKFVFGNGLLTASAHLWKKSRKQLNHLFLPRSLQFIVPALNENCRQMVAELSTFIGQGHKDVLPVMNLFGVTNVLNLLFGPKVQQDLCINWKIRMVEAISTISGLLVSRVVYPWLQIDFLFHWYYKKTLQQTDDLEDTGPPESLYALKKQFEPSKTSYQNGISDTSLMQDNQSRSSNLAEAFNNLSKKDQNFDEKYRLGEMRTLIATGAETNAITLSSCLLTLGSHPIIQQKVYDEIVNTVGATYSEIGFEEVKNLTYMEKVLKETMRRFVISPIIARRTEQDLQLSDCIVPAHVTVMLSIVGVHWNPIIYPDPLKFDPERFSEEKTAKRESYTFFPFSGGARDCIGKHYAMLILKIALVHILREYEIYSAVDIDKLRHSFSISFNSVEGYEIVLKNRTADRINRGL